MENLENFYILDDEMNFFVGFVSQNLVTKSNFVKFENSRNFSFLRHRVSDDTWGGAT